MDSFSNLVNSSRNWRILSYLNLSSSLILTSRSKFNYLITSKNWLCFLGVLTIGDFAYDDFLVGVNDLTFDSGVVGL